MAKYSGTGPYSATTIVDEQYLDILRPRTVPSSSDDFLYTIESQYSRRPDLLAFDLYGSPKLWWVFAQRNPDTLQDPIFDFTPGTEIYIPKGNAIREALGV